MSVIETLAEFADGMNPPAAARQCATLCVLDWAGAVIAGANTMPATGLRAALGPPPGAASLWPDGATCDPRSAALINGTAAHIAEVDDIYSPGLFHPGVVTIPAALALGDHRGVNGHTALDAIIAGYEIGNRIARAVNPSHYTHWHTTATIGSFSAAVAGSKALGLTSGIIAHAMATAATMAAGLRHAFSSDAMSKPLHAGRAAEAGVLAALAADQGVTGVLDILEGARGFGMAMSDVPDWDAMRSDLGTEWTVMQTTTKAHACCGHNFAALDAIAALRNRAELALADRIDIATYQTAVDVCGNPEPQTPAEARFSLPWCAAVMARTGSLTPDATSRTALACGETRALAQRVRLSVSDQAEAAFPSGRQASVAITMPDARVLSHHRKSRKGDPDDPLTQKEIVEKFHALVDPILGTDRADALVSRLLSIDALNDIRLLLA